MTATRLVSGGLIDRSKALRFSFNGRAFIGYQGDTLASALLANGVSLTARSWKYHRPRGILAAGAEEPKYAGTTEHGRPNYPECQGN